MDDIERTARLLCEADAADPDAVSVIWSSRRSGYLTNLEVQMRRAEKLAVAGLTIRPLEPYDATVDEMARGLGMTVIIGDASLASILERGLNDRSVDRRLVRDTLRAIARAAYRAAVKGER